MRTIPRVTIALAFALVLSLGVTLSAIGGGETPGSSNQEESEFERFEVQASALVAPTAPDTCEAVQNQVGAMDDLKAAEQTLAAIRAQQVEILKQRGWTEREAAAAGEGVMLNGSGYNYRAAIR